MFRHFFITVLIACLITTLTHYYLYLRLVVPIVGENDPLWMGIFLGLWAITILGFPILRILPHFLRKVFEFFMFLWMGVAFIALMFCIATLPFEILFKYLQLSPMYVWSFVMVGTILVSVYSIFSALRLPRIAHVSIPLKKDFPKEIENLRIAVISDVHVSGLIGKKRTQKIADIVNSLNADVVFVTGDLMDGTIEQLHKEIAPFKNITAKKNVLYITGNHEFYNAPHRWKDFFKKEFNWKILSNSSHIISFENFDLNVLGVEDRHWLKYKKISKHNDKRLQTSVNHLKARIKDEQKFSYNILLAHQPKDWKHFVQFPWIDLQISGHTHGGGQMWPMHFFVKRDQKYYAGLYKISHTGQHIYVNQGTGFWGPPMRLGTKSEITLMTFKVSS